MTQVNLLPGDVRERQKVRRLTALVVTGVVAVLALLFFVFVLQSARLANAKHQLDAQQVQNTALQSKIGQLAQFQQLKLQLSEKEALVTGAKVGAIAWSGVLRDISMVIPNKMWLTGMTATVALTAPTVITPAPVTPSGTTGTATPVVPTGPAIAANLQFAGVASDYPTVALWLTRLEQVDGWVNAWFSTASKQGSSDSATATCTTAVDGTQTCTTADPLAGKVNFTGTIDLTTLATIDGGKK